MVRVTRGHGGSILGRVQFGVLYDFRNPVAWQRPWPDFYRGLLDQIISLEELGFDAVWLTEHHFVADGYLPAVFPVAGAIAARTRRLRIGTNLLLLPLHHPVLVAENAAVLDVLSDGRFTLGVGLGYRDEEFRGLGVARAERPGRMEEGLRLVRQCWAAEGPFDHFGRYWRLAGVDVQPKPVQAGGVPIWVGARGDRALDRAARLGDGWLAAGAGHSEYLAYRSACEQHGRPIGPIAALRNVWVGDWSEAERFATYMQTSYRQWYGQAADLPVDTVAATPANEYPLPLDWYWIGEPGFITDQLLAAHAEVPFDQLIMVLHFAGADLSQSQSSISRFARHVLPRFK
jgi:alkanesulfonate monooxygenase SsuD/methylene tetrahydromethanopterin reductase-like flavin-dependent oxidoreductase (luciferase family)